MCRIISIEEFKEIELDLDVLEVNKLGFASDGYHYSYHIKRIINEKVWLTPEENEKY